MNYATKLSQIKGVGPKTAAHLSLAGLDTIHDIITFLPRRFEDFSEVVSIADIVPGKKTIKARCETISIRRVKRSMTIVTATLVDDTGKLKAVWFNQPYRMTQLKNPDEVFFFSGDFEFTYNTYQLTNPSTEKQSDIPVSTDRIVPIYRAVKGLKSQLVRKILVELKPFMTMLPETLPGDIVTREKLLSYADAITLLHFPESADDVTKARERLGFEELLQLQIASQLNRRDNQQLPGWAIPFDQQRIKSFVASLPFQLTGAQRRAAWEVIQDFEKSLPMNRLLQGDVGSGKTVVAALAAYSAAGGGFQTAIMAPTEILATQHAETLHRLLEPHGISVSLLTGSVKGEKRKIVYDAIQTGAVQVIIGTHALIQDTVQFHKLGFVVIDEQHRFGVAQRQKLLEKSDRLPHLLAMTATPIPRSLQLTVFGELDVSVLDELPPGRQAITSKICSPNSRSQLYAAIDVEITAGRQVYVVTPLIDDNPTMEQASAEKEFTKLSRSTFKHRRVGMLHGRMSAADKERVMQEFKEGKYDILVSTTVIEVGVDVPNATVMLIENADRFGLSQLHQLRGRVGRGTHQSYCYLMMSDSKKPTERLREIERSQDGFYLAEVDLKLRGPGEIYGRAQHGALNLQIASLADTKLIARTQKAAIEFVQSGQDLLHYTELAREVKHYQRLTTLN